MLKRLLPRKAASCWLGAGEAQLELEKHFTVQGLMSPVGSVVFKCAVQQQVGKAPNASV